MDRATKSLIFHENYFTTFWEISQENGPLAEKMTDRKSKRTRQKNKRANKKRESNDSPEIPDRGGGIRHPRPHLGGIAQTRGFDSQQERRKKLLLRGQLSVQTYLGIRSIPVLP